MHVCMYVYSPKWSSKLNADLGIWDGLGALGSLCDWGH